MSGRQWIREIGGLGLLVIGVLGCFLPVIPGVPILIAGIGLLGTDHPVVRKCRNWLERKGWWPSDERLPKV